MKTESKQANHFGFWTLTFLVVANMIGGGVFSTSGFTMGDLHSPGYVVLAWLVAGLIAIAGAISYGQLIRVMPESGGEYVFLSRAYHPMFGFVAGWVSMFAGFTGAIAYAASLFETYAVPADLRAKIGLPDDFVAIGVVVVAAIFHGIKIKAGVIGQNLAVILKLLLLVLFLGFALFRLGSVEAVNDLEPLAAGDFGVAFCKSLMWISLSYMGFNAAVYVAEEAGDAKSKIPKALLTGTSIVVVFYVLLNAVFVYSADASKVAESGPAVAAFAAQQLGGATFAIFFQVIISIALFTSVTSMMMAAPRVYAKMADDGMLPAIFSFQKNAPQYAMLLQVALAVVIICWSTLESLLGYLGITLSICAAASVSSLFLPKYRNGESVFSLPMIAPALYVGSTIFIVIMICQYREIAQLYAAIATFVVGVIFYGMKERVSAFAQHSRAKKLFANSSNDFAAVVYIMLIASFLSGIGFLFLLNQFLFGS